MDYNCKKNKLIIIYNYFIYYLLNIIFIGTRDFRADTELTTGGANFKIFRGHVPYKVDFL